MMQLKKLFTPVGSMDADEAKAYMAGHREGDYTLLDVRQPGEYEDSHLPGAKLLPLPGLSDTYQELDGKTRPGILRHRRPQPGGGPDAFRLGVQGGLQPGGRYQGLSRAQGHRADGAQPGPGQGGRVPAAIIILAYGMEKALQLFYETLKQQSPDSELQELFGKLAQVEVRHEQRLFEVYGRVVSGGQDLATFESTIVRKTLEGGFSAEKFLATNKSHLQTVPEVLDLAMMLETQALDLYLRFANLSDQPQTKEVLYTLAGEEKAHLASLGRLLDEKSGSEAEPHGDYRHGSVEKSAPDQLRRLRATDLPGLCHPRDQGRGGP